MNSLSSTLGIISVLQWVITFLVMGAACALILLYIGRHPEWVRNWTVWKHFRDYFPIRLIKTHTFLLIRNYIFEYHPHGIVYFGAFCNSGTEATGFSKKIPGICPHLATLSGNFRLPLPQDYLLSGGICPVNRKAIDYIFSKSGTGNSVGGAAESLDCTPGKNIVTLKNRKGFVKLALHFMAVECFLQTLGVLCRIPKQIWFTRHKYSRSPLRGKNVFDVQLAALLLRDFHGCV
uniref:Diacylglycerol O-acyltransferase 2 n=1 Tax=Erpetoichthys calabaricus TaxID=27687 RepID=A0A8C4RKK1_ERPCA